MHGHKKEERRREGKKERRANLENTFSPLLPTFIDTGPVSFVLGCSGRITFVLTAAPFEPKAFIIVTDS